MTKPSGRGRHSFIQFYMNDWSAGTARMPRLVRSVYFDLCCYTWDKVRPVPKGELAMMLADLGENGDKIVETLIDSEQIVRGANGSVHSPRALAEAERALAAWLGKSRGGSAKPAGREKEDTSQDTSKSVPLEPEPEPERVPVGTANAVDPLKDLFDKGVDLLTKAGKTEKQARSLIGKWRKQMEGDGPVLTGLIECQARSISDPVEWLTKRFAGGKRYVSASGYEYRGTPEQVMRAAELRADHDIYWAVKGDMQRAR